MVFDLSDTQMIVCHENWRGVPERHNQLVVLHSR
jgi:hypothetical protein